jgi:hypothetical protein
VSLAGDKTILTIDTLAAISPGGSHVPPYTVINQHIDYKFDSNRGFDMPVISGAEPLFGKSLDESAGAALIDRGKMVIQSRACIDCDTFFGNGAYYAPDRANRDKGAPGVVEWLPPGPATWHVEREHGSRWRHCRCSRQLDCSTQRRTVSYEIWLEGCGVFSAICWDREFADSPLEESGFEPLVPLNLRVLGEYDGIRDQRTTRDFA